MTNKEFKRKTFSLFKNYEVIHNSKWYFQFNINNMTLSVARFNQSFELSCIEDENELFKTTLILYLSPKYSTFEQFYDGLVIFKELILPKYL